MQFSLASSPTYLSLVLQCGKCCRPVPIELTTLVLIVWFDFPKARKSLQGVANHVRQITMVARTLCKRSGESMPEVNWNNVSPKLTSDCINQTVCHRVP